MNFSCKSFDILVRKSGNWFAWNGVIEVIQVQNQAEISVLLIQHTFCNQVRAGNLPAL
jgi:hypothetical protein